jgi:hypothetical protein
MCTALGRVCADMVLMVRTLAGRVVQQQQQGWRSSVDASVAALGRDELRTDRRTDLTRWGVLLPGLLARACAVFPCVSAA